MKQLADNLWIFDGESVTFMALPFATRMTIVRLDDGALWVHSPIKLTETIRQQLSSLGEVKYLIAPNRLHHLFIDAWLKAYPDAQSYGTDEVIKKRKDLRFDASLNQAQEWPWQKEIDQLLFTGSFAMEEAIFFHRGSSTLIVTDLIENVSGDTFKPWQKYVAKRVGILAPNGKMPLDWRLSFVFGKSTARAHINRIISWRPSAIVMSHGEIIEQDAEHFLKTSFSWLI
uniref:DUF4336 domain-containing protein n=1 Tax=Thaumasiovibrio occultus TaxID=1891184 RepID=UPI000B3548CC|nr:DUF4336 domain-containing protein [Thaumasiovibrio occultus]